MFKKYFAVLIACILFNCLVQTGSADNKIPQTVDEAVRELKSKWLSKEELDWVLRNPKQVVTAHFHLPFGTQVRNEWKLWEGDSVLLKSCGASHPEDCSGIIFEKLWESVRKDASPNLLKQLDCQFRLVSLIKVSYRGFYKQRIGEILKNLEKQINDQQADAGLELNDDCASKIKLKVSGEPDLNCWSRVEFSEDGRDPVTLDRFLGWISFRNGFSIRHSPPNIDLIFHEKCSWREFPEQFRPDEAQKQ